MDSFLYNLNATLVMIVAILVALAVISAIALRGWREWIALRREELSHRRPPPSEQTHSHGDAIEPWIELADLRERLRKLEAIAAGVDP